MDFSIEGGHHVSPLDTAEPSLSQLQKLSGLFAALSSALERDLRENSQWSVAEVLQDFMRAWKFLREIGLDGGRGTVTPIGCEPREMLHALREIRDFMGIYESQIGNSNAWSIRPGAHAGRVSSSLFIAVAERWTVAIAALAKRQVEKAAAASSIVDAESDDLMTLYELSKLVFVSSKALRNRMILSEPAIKGGGRGRKAKWHYLKEKTAIETAYHLKLPDLSEARKQLSRDGDASSAG
ncbi:MAG: hypothetical protein K8U03_26765 [Planctomycetia bacterium]|nr:hypothetical protein [Planctomycetia bacterium]